MSLSNGVTEAKQFLNDPMRCKECFAMFMVRVIERRPGGEPVLEVTEWHDPACSLYKDRNKKKEVLK